MNVVQKFRSMVRPGSNDIMEIKLATGMSSSRQNLDGLLTPAEATIIKAHDTVTVVDREVAAIEEKVEEVSVAAAEKIETATEKTVHVLKVINEKTGGKLPEDRY